MRLRAVADEHHAADKVGLSRRTRHKASLVNGEVRESAVRAGARLLVPHDFSRKLACVLRPLAELLVAGVGERKRTGPRLDEAAVRLGDFARERQRRVGIRHLERVGAVLRRPDGQVTRHGSIAARPVEDTLAHDEGNGRVLRVHERGRIGRRVYARTRLILGPKATRRQHGNPRNLFCSHLCASFHRRAPLSRRAKFTLIQFYLGLSYHIPAFSNKSKVGSTISHLPL